MKELKCFHKFCVLSSCSNKARSLRQENHSLLNLHLFLGYGNIQMQLPGKLGASNVLETFPFSDVAQTYNLTGNDLAKLNPALTC